MQERRQEVSDGFSLDKLQAPGHRRHLLSVSPPRQVKHPVPEAELPEYLWELSGERPGEPAKETKPPLPPGARTPQACGEAEANVRQTPEVLGSFRSRKHVLLMTQREGEAQLQGQTLHSGALCTGWRKPGKRRGFPSALMVQGCSDRLLPRQGHVLWKPPSLPSP